MVLDTQKLKVLIFDMDDTLLDTFGQLVRPASTEACEAMIRAGLDASLDQCVQTRAALAGSHPRHNIYVELTRHFGVTPGADPEVVAKAGFEAFHDREIKENIQAFDDAHDTLQTLARDYVLYLVTLGTPKTQKKKVSLLRLESLFVQVFFVDVAKEKTKTGAFKKILGLNHGLPVRAHASIGNRIDSDIKDAKELGMQTILMQHGEYLHLKPVSPYEEPDHRITRLAELKEILAKAKPAE